MQTLSAYSAKLRWDGNGNANDTIFGIEAKIGGGAWELVGFTRKKSYAYTADSTAKPVTLRVFAMRGERRSATSGTATAFAPIGESALPRLAA